jgi:tripartite-type tricarboxylate transporter receptor subunit TctC
LTRSPVLPDVPTIAEAGVPGYEATNWWGIVAPAGTPASIIETLHNETRAVLQSPKLQEQFAREGASPVEMSPAEFGKYMESEIAKWGRVVEQGKIRAQ